MPNYKANLFFTSRTYGWSETYYKVAANYTEMLTKINALVNVRQDALCASAQLNYARFTDEDAARDSFLFKPDGNRNGALNVVVDQAFVAVKVKMRATNLYWRQLYMRGIPDDISSPDNGDSPRNLKGFNTAFLAYTAFLTNQADPWAMKVINKANPRIAILSAVSLPNPLTSEFQTASAHGLVVGDYVKVYNLRNSLPNQGAMKPVGTRLVLAVPAPDRFQISYTIPTLFQYSETAKARKVTPFYVTITTADFDGVSHRIVGRPFDLSRGRRPVIR